MNYSTAVMLFNDNIRAIHVSYEPSQSPGIPPKVYTYKTVDATIKAGDLVIVPTDSRHYFTVVKVEAVDVEVDFDSSTQLKWIVDKVDTVGYTSVLAEEQKWIDAIKESEKRKKRETIKNNMQEMLAANGVDSVPTFAAHLQLTAE